MLKIFFFSSVLSYKKSLKELWEEKKKRKKKEKYFFFLHFNSETITHANWQFCLVIRSLSLSPPSILQRLISPTKMAQSAKANSIRGF